MTTTPSQDLESTPQVDRASLRNRVICGDAADILTTFCPDSVDCIVTSPPYFRQRDYGVQTQLGAESTPEEYVARVLGIMRQCYRVLAPTGAMWLNIGDKFLDGQLAGVPWRVALAMKDQGWKLRCDVIWHKPNAMPHSVKTRPTIDHEYLFFFSKSDDYYYDVDAIREPHVTFSENSRMKGGRNHFFKKGGTPEQGKNSGNSNLHDGRWDQAFHPLGRNKRSVWSIPLSKFRDAHFAVFPERLVEPCILASTRRGCLVLDPFFGSGTVGLVASNLGRDYVGVELSPEYAEMAMSRIRKEKKPTLL